MVAVGCYLHPFTVHIANAFIPAGSFSADHFLRLGAVAKGEVLAVGREIRVIDLVLPVAFDELLNVGDVGLAGTQVDIGDAEVPVGQAPGEHVIVVSKVRPAADWPIERNGVNPACRRP